MQSTDNTAARGTLMLVFSQGCYYILGYLTVVLLARNLGPAVYGTYGVIISVLVWLEQSGRFAVPTATAKLLSESTEGSEEVEKSAMVLNLAFYCFLFVVLWSVAPLLEAWFSVDNGTFLFRLAAIDLPIFGIYTALQATHQGHRRFFRLGLAEIMYAFAKLAGVLLVLRLGVSVDKALVVNVVSSVVGAALLFSGTRLRSGKPWLARVLPIVSAALPLAFYSVLLLLMSSLGLWTLRITSTTSEAAVVGIFVAALNIARVPGYALSSVAGVVLPSVSKAVARGDEALVRRYVRQALRFFCVFYVPICLALAPLSEALMQWVYSSKFSGGGPTLTVLLVAQGLWGIHAIVGSVLVAAGQARRIGMVMAMSVVPAVPVFVLSVRSYGSVGAAAASIAALTMIIPVFYLLLRQRFGSILPLRTLANVSLGGSMMWLSNALLPPEGMGVILLPMLSVGLYGAVLFLLGEIRQEDFAVFRSRKGTQ